MKLADINEVLDENLKNFDQALTGIRHCLAAYERECQSLVNKIGQCLVAADADPIFDVLSEIQCKLALIGFGHDIALGTRLEKIAREFDRLDDPNIRNFWYEKFRSGESWPE